MYDAIRLILGLIIVYLCLYIIVYIDNYLSQHNTISVETLDELIVKVKKT